MNVMLRPLSLGELLDRAFQLYRSRFALFVGIAAVAYLPLFLVQLTSLWLPKMSPSAATATGIAFFLGLLLRLVGVAAANAATIIVVSAAYLEHPITLREAYGRVSGMLWRVFFIMIGMGIGITIGLVLLVIPGIILFLMWGLAIPVAVLEDAGLGDSLSRSRALTAGHRGRVFVIYLLYFTLMLALEVGLLGPLVALLAVQHGPAATASPFAQVLSYVILLAIEALVTPVLTISLSLMYYDERVRKEAFDIHLMMTALGEGPAEAAAGAS